MKREDTADNMAVRRELVRRMDAGEITLAEAQRELRKLKRAARKRGEPTLHDFHRAKP